MTLVDKIQWMEESTQCWQGKTPLNIPCVMRRVHIGNITNSLVSSKICLINCIISVKFANIPGPLMTISWVVKLMICFVMLVYFWKLDKILPPLSYVNDNILHKSKEGHKLRLVTILSSCISYISDQIGVKMIFIFPLGCSNDGSISVKYRHQKWRRWFLLH